MRSKIKIAFSFAHAHNFLITVKTRREFLAVLASGAIVTQLRAAEQLPDEIRIAIIEDNDALRESLKKTVNSFDDCVCVATFPDGKEALAELPACKPRVVLVDINLPPGSPGKNGALKPLRRRAPVAGLFWLISQPNGVLPANTTKIGP